MTTPDSTAGNIPATPISDPCRRRSLPPPTSPSVFGVARAAVSNWRRRYGPGSSTPFPAPEEGHPTPVWHWERWPEIDAWHEQRGGYRRGRRTNTRRPSESQFLSVKDIADQLNVTSGVVRQWRRKQWSIPFPPPDEEITQNSRTVARWRADRLPDIRWWREWHLNHLATRSRQRSRQDSSPSESPDRQGAKVTFPPPSHFLKSVGSPFRAGVRQGRLAHPTVRRTLL